VVTDLTLQQRQLVSFLIQSGRTAIDDRKQLILLLLGGAGCGKSKTLKAAIMMFFAMYDSKTFCFLCPTKFSASIANGVTFSSFVGIKTWSDAELEDGNVHAMSLTKSQRSSIRLVRTIFLDEFGVLSKHHLKFLNTLLKAVHENDDFFGGIDVVFCEHYLECGSLLDSSILASSDCLLFNLSEKKSFCSILNHMKDGTATSEMLEEINDKWGSASVGNKRVISFIIVSFYHCLYDLEFVFTEEESR
jgi:hypothetical protein